MRISKLIASGIFSGAVLAASMKLIRKMTGNPSEILLYNVDYIPFFKKYKHIPGVGLGFHYATCVLSTVGLYYILKPFRIEKNITPYVLVYSAGGGALYFLSALTNEPPEYNDTAAWNYWTGSHALFGVAVGTMVKSLN